MLFKLLIAVLDEQHRLFSFVQQFYCSSLLTLLLLFIFFFSLFNSQVDTKPHTRLHSAVCIEKTCVLLLYLLSLLGGGCCSKLLTKHILVRALQHPARFQSRKMPLQAAALAP